MAIFEKQITKSSHLGHIAFVILLFLIGGLVGYGVGKAYESDRVAGESSDQTAIRLLAGSKKQNSTSESKFLPPTDWKTYVNSLGYSIKYPPSRTLAPISLGDGDGGPNDPGLYGTRVIYISDGQSKELTVHIIDCDTPMSFIDVQKSIISDNNGYILSKKEIIVGGKKAYSIEVKDQYNYKFCGEGAGGGIGDVHQDPPVGSPARLITAVDGKKIIVIVDAPTSDNEGDKMLSTLEFTK